MSFSANIKALASWTWTDGATDSSTLDYAKSHADGNTENKAEAVWHAEDQVLLSGESATLDLTALTRTVLGDIHTLTLLTVKAILIVNKSTSGGGELLVGGAAANCWWYPFGDSSDIVSIPMDSPLLLANRQWGWAVDAANKNLKLLASGGDVTYSIVVIGTVSTTASGSSGA